MTATEIRIDPDGTVRFVYSDDLTPLLRLGRATVRRASHVEPAPGGGWTADMGPAGGPVLGPYRLRRTALAAELRWLRAHDLGGAR